ncbi:phage terminase large subunit [Tumebacillus lipolyticus]|uniref:Phage terminase large subunit n=1 Tax=Tumebacillus lipolyticus TaxID=1280370 RepID=A0ABW5A2A3_9BACL
MTNQPYAAVVDLEAVIDLYYDYPVDFAEDILGVELDGWQQRVLSDLAGHRFVSVRSGQGVGKTALEAIAVCWYICTRPFPKIVCTAPTRQQLMDVLWAEIAKWIDGTILSDLLEWTKTRIYMKGYADRWFATARTATKPENMQGFHEDHMLFIADEASGIEDKIMEAILGTLSGPENKLLMCGNPTRTSGVFYESHHKDRSNYKTHRVSSLDSPRTSKENIEMLKRKYGEDSDVYRIRVIGEFPRSEPNVLIALELAELATECRVVPTETTLHLGVDVARFGDDETVIAPRIGGKVFPLHCYSKRDTMETAGNVIYIAKTMMAAESRLQRVKIKVDDTGVGGGVTDRLNELVREEGLPYEVYPVNNGSVADDTEFYDNKASESWAVIKEALQENFTDHVQGKLPTVELPDDGKLITQLTTRKYRMTSKGRLQVERKEDMKKRGLQSPDRAEAVILSFVEPPEPVPVVVKTDRIDISDLANAY